jgi:hypothetical protein
MSTESTTKPVTPLRCTRCGDEDGPFVPGTGLCEPCARPMPLEDVA